MGFVGIAEGPPAAAKIQPGVGKQIKQISLLLEGKESTGGGEIQEFLTPEEIDIAFRRGKIGGQLDIAVVIVRQDLITGNRLLLRQVFRPKFLQICAEVFGIDHTVDIQFDFFVVRDAGRGDSKRQIHEAESKQRCQHIHPRMINKMIPKRLSCQNGLHHISLPRTTAVLLSKNSTNEAEKQG